MVGSSCLIDEQLCADILRSIFKRLSTIDLVRLKTVSSYWNSLVEDQIFHSPWLMLPSKQVIDGGITDVHNNTYSSFLKLGESQVSNLTRIPRIFREGCCVGSSNGWLVFLEDQAVPSLFHPFKQVQIQLPSINDLIGVKKLERSPEGDYKVESFGNSGITSTYTKNRLRFLIQKLILMGEPDHDYKNFGVIMLCNKVSDNSNSILLYYRSGSKSWTSTLLDPEAVYQDIIWKEDHLYVLNENQIEIWDLEDDIIVKKRNNILIPMKISALRYGICGSRWSFWFYLCESCGDILLVVRCMKRFSCLNVEPQTTMFQVYKLDTNIYEFLPIESLGDRMLFIGGNESTSASIQSFSTVERNSIYYTDNRIGGYDVGVYNLTNQTVKPILKLFPRQIVPLPYLIIPPSTTTSSHLKL